MSDQQTKRRYDWGAGTGLQFEIERSAEATAGELVELTMFFAPGMAGPPVHTHPVEETFEVREGEIEVNIDGAWTRYGTGETALVPTGVAHAVRNVSTEPAVVTNIHRPAVDMEAFFVDGARLPGEGKIKGLPPKDPRSAIHAAMLLTKYDRDMRVTNPQRVVFRALAVIGRRLGYTLTPAG